MASELTNCNGIKEDACVKDYKRMNNRNINQLLFNYFSINSYHMAETVIDAREILIKILNC